MRVQSSPFLSPELHATIVKVSLRITSKIQNKSGTRKIHLCLSNSRCSPWSCLLLCLPILPEVLSLLSQDSNLLRMLSGHSCPHSTDQNTSYGQANIDTLNTPVGEIANSYDKGHVF